jgi:peptidoglycan L-alanyl-D-glutamate endopeptidase CwlK
MSQQLFKNDVLFLQRILKVSGFYKGALDGKWSPAVDKAEDDFEAAYNTLKQQMGAFDTRTERNIETLLPAAQKFARTFMSAVKGLPNECRIISGTRTYAEQDQLFAIGRTIRKNEKKVTNARGGESNHNFSIAWDIGLFTPAGKYLTGDTKSEQKAYADVAKLVKQQIPGLEWGGDWDSFEDPPHYQLATGKSLKQVRTLFEAGKPFV